MRRSPSGLSRLRRNRRQEYGIEPAATKKLSPIVRDNAERGRFELDRGDAIAIAEYRLDSGTITFTRTETPLVLRGQGIASELIRNALLAARERGLKVETSCSFVADYLKRHPESSDLSDR